MVVSRPLLSIAEDFVGANDLPELQSGIGIARMDIGVGPFDGFTECGPETFSFIARKSPEQIVKRLHVALAAGFPCPSPKFPPRIYCGALVQTARHRLGQC